MIPVEVDLGFDDEKKKKKADRLSRYQELIKQNKENEEAGAKN